MQAVQLRDRHQVLKEREQCLKEMKYEEKIVRMNIVEMCAEGQT